MKKIIEESGMTIKEFAEYYEIPYNTVRQWYNKTSNAPKYLTKLLKENRELKTKGKQLEINIDTNMTLYELLKNMRSTYTPIEIYNEDCTFIEQGYNHEIKKKYGNNSNILKREIYDISLNGESEQIMITLKMY